MTANYVTDTYDTVDDLAAAIEEISTTTPIQVVPLPYWNAHRYKNDYKYLVIRGPDAD
jgi:hypothetical protein